MRIIPDKIYKTMWRVQWEDGSLSADFYNKTRANDHSNSQLVEMLGIGQSYDAPIPRLEAR